MNNIEEEIKECKLKQCMETVEIYRIHYEYERDRAKKLEIASLILALVIVVLVVALMECLYFNL